MRGLSLSRSFCAKGAGGLPQFCSTSQTGDEGFTSVLLHTILFYGSGSGAGDDRRATAGGARWGEKGSGAAYIACALACQGELGEAFPRIGHPQHFVALDACIVACLPLPQSALRSALTIPPPSPYGFWLYTQSVRVLYVPSKARKTRGCLVLHPVFARRGFRDAIDNLTMVNS